MLSLVITRQEPGIYIDRYLCDDCSRGKKTTGISGFGKCEKCGKQ